MWTVSLDGGLPTLVSDSLGFLAQWGPDGMIYGTHLGGLARVGPTGGQIERLTVPERPGVSHQFPSVLPDGTGIVFTEVPLERAEARVAVLDTESRDWSILTPGFAAAYVPSGHIAFVRDGGLYVARFDHDALDLAGPAVPLIENVGSGFRGAGFATSPSGDLLYTTLGRSQESLFWVDRSGTEQLASADTADFERVAISPDGSRFAAVSETANLGDVYVYGRQDGTRSILTFDGVNEQPAWIDSRWISFTSIARDTPDGIYRRPWDGGAASDLVLATDAAPRNLSWSNGGRLLLFDQLNGEGVRDVFSYALGEDSAHAVVSTQATEVTASLSPNGRWLAYASNETGNFEIWVESFPTGGGRWQVSTDGGVQPRWARSGRELFFRSVRSGDMMVTEVETDPTFTFDPTPRRLFPAARYEQDLQQWSYDVSNDERFLLIRDLEQDQTLSVVLNWFEELRQRVPN